MAGIGWLVVCITSAGHHDILLRTILIYPDELEGRISPHHDLDGGVWKSFGYSPTDFCELYKYVNEGSLFTSMSITWDSLRAWRLKANGHFRKKTKV